MSYPGFANTNLAADLSTQYGSNESYYVLSSGAGPVAISSLQSPASIVPAVDNSVALTVASNQSGSIATISLGNNQTGDASVLNIKNGNFGASEILLGNAQVSLAVEGLDSKLVISNALNPADVAASFDTLTNVVELGNPLEAGQIYLNNRTTVTNQGARPPTAGLIIENNSATESAIYGQVATGGLLVLGSSATSAPDILTLGDTGNNTGTVTIGGNGGNNIVMTGSTNNAAATITSDRQPGNLGALTLGGSVGAPGISLTDSGVSFLQDSQTALNTTLTIRGDINMATTSVIRNYANYQTTGNAALGNGASATITSTNPPPNGIGLYCITIYAPSDLTANVSAVAFWNGNIWYGGSVGNAAFRIQSVAGFASLTLFNTSGVGMAGVWQSNVFQILGPTTS